MTIQVRCQGCDRVLGVGPEHAGKRARCPVCGHITDVPSNFGTPDSHSPYTSEPADFRSAAADPMASGPLRSASGDSSSAGAGQWRMRTPEGQIYGPVNRAELDRWVAEGRISYECQLQQGEGRWSEAVQTYPVLTPPGTHFTPASSTPLADTQPIYTPEPIESKPEYYRPAASASPYGAGAMNTARNPYATPAAGGYHASYVVDHRGGLILAMAIISWLFPCGSLVLGLPTCIMAQNDLSQMNSGRMDPAGRSLTHAGMVIAIINVVCLLLGIAFGFLGMVLA